MSRLALVLTFALALAAVVVADHYVYTIEQVYYTGTVNCDNTPQSNSSYPNGTCALLINGGGSTNVSCDANGYPSGWACPGNTPTCAASEGTTCGFIDGGEGQVWGTSHCLGGFGTSLSITCIETLTPGAPPTAPTAPTYVNFLAMPRWTQDEGAIGPNPPLPTTLFVDRRFSPLSLGIFGSRRVALFAGALHLAQN